MEMMFEHVGQTGRCTLVGEGRQCVYERVRRVCAAGEAVETVRYSPIQVDALPIHAPWAVCNQNTALCEAAEPAGTCAAPNL